MVQEVQGSVLEGKPRFQRFESRILRFVPIPNGKFTHFLIFYALQTFGLVQGTVILGGLEVRSSDSEEEPRLGRFELQFF